MASPFFLSPNIASIFEIVSMKSTFLHLTFFLIRALRFDLSLGRQCYVRVTLFHKTWPRPFHLQPDHL